MFAQAKLRSYVAIAKSVRHQRHNLFFAIRKQVLPTCVQHSNARNLADGIEKIVEVLRAGAVSISFRALPGSGK